MRPDRSVGFCALPLCTLALFMIPVARAQSPSIDRTLALRHFSEAKALSDRDAGRLWGMEMYGPMMFVEPQTRAIVANQSDGEGHLIKEGDVFVGTLPVGEMMANTAVTWAGLKWTMVIWPLPDDENDRACLMMHELWHRIQNDLGFPGSGFANKHLDTRDGRVWLRLEWRALGEALRLTGDGRRSAVEDSLTFRAFRRSLFPDAAGEERALEMNEGLAEYTGIRLSTDSYELAAARAVRNLRHGKGYDTFVRSFAYASGPAYGLLLDKASPDWRKKLQGGDDLGVLLMKGLDVTIPADLEIEAKSRSKAYKADQLISEEDQRESARQGRAGQYHRRFVEGPVLVLPLLMMKIQFDPRNLEPLGDLGTVYPTATISDGWGTLKVTGGCLVKEGFLRSRVVVPVPADPNARPVAGDGWTLDLKDGWEIAPGERQGDYVVRTASKKP